MDFEVLRRVVNAFIDEASATEGVCGFSVATDEWPESTWIELGIGMKPEKYVENATFSLDLKVWGKLSDEQLREEVIETINNMIDVIEERG